MHTESQNKLESKIEFWKTRLLDTTKRNRLLNFIENSRSNITFEDFFPISLPDFYETITQKETIKLPFPFPGIIENEIVDGEIRNTKKTAFEKTLKSLKKKANTSLQEQGINTLYVAFGFLEWFEAEHSQEKLLSPLLLVPVNILITNNNDEKTFSLELRDDEIIFNPTLRYKLSNDFGLELSKFDDEPTDIVKYFKDFQDCIQSNPTRKRWQICEKAILSILSFHKISMFEMVQKNGTLFCIKNAENGSKENQENTLTL